jgi:hypothetical protein
LLKAAVTSAVALGVAKALTEQLSKPDLEALRVEAQTSFKELVGYLEILESTRPTPPAPFYRDPENTLGPKGVKSPEESW